MPSPFGGRTNFGPKGFLGIPPRRFKERTLPVQTTARITQAQLEVWRSTAQPETRFTQVGLEVWINSDDQLRRLVNVYFL